MVIDTDMEFRTSSTIGGGTGPTVARRWGLSRIWAMTPGGTLSSRPGSICASPAFISLAKRVVIMIPNAAVPMVPPIPRNSCPAEVTTPI